MTDEHDRQHSSGQPSGDGEHVQADANVTGDMTQDAIQQELAQARASAAEHLDHAQRARAELINYRRRTEQEIQQIRQFASERVITRLLPVVDDFNRALDNVPDAEKESGWVQGLVLIQRKLWSVLESEGVEAINAVGQPFDPSLHEAVTVESEGNGNMDTVIEEFQRGYTLHGRLIRPAMVKVGRASSTEPRTGSNA